MFVYHAPHVTGSLWYAPEPSQPLVHGARICIGSPLSGLRRFPGVVTTDAFGGAVVYVDLDALPSGGEIWSGSTWRMPFAFRDAAGAGGASQGMRVTFCP